MAHIQYRRGVPGVLPNAWLIQPEAGRNAAAPVIAVHGLNREAEGMAKLLAPRADATGRTVILPIFDRTSWPRFQRAACPQRSDWALLNLLKVLREEGHIGDAPPDLSGFSGGAQFAHRFAWLYPDHVGRLCLVSPGWWTFPDARGAHPLGIDANARGKGAAAFRLRANLARFFDREIQVAVGALDVVQDKNLRQDPEIMAQQGADRVTRARRWSAAAIRAARGAGLLPQIAFKLMGDCGHSFADCVANARLDRVFVPAVKIETNTRSLCREDKFVEVA
ncbi:alpha/beta hydrolase [Gymnodinialimonas sp. 2305UL16-5]|uniref:alpha/beta fold hydrolase n=1 Tax=Gymnodinialimonas mytili TaxID=3126503 RepID=UPI0030A9D952